ncbi:MAG TPA: glycosyltransferase family 39 protein [Myxococcota bacterium]|nr:glycosyltransferase family 39 protein [Myxococcota bacterium]
MATRVQKFWLLAAIAVATVALLWHLGGYPLVQPDEGRNAEVAREMERSGSWLIPTLNDVPYLDKPAFYFKVVALSLSSFGESEWAARLPSALFGLCTLGLVYGLCQRQYTAERAAMATIMVSTSPLFIMYSRLVIFDSALTFFISAAILAAYCAEMFPGLLRARWHAAGALAAGIATLVKGPVGFVVPALILSAFFLLEGRRDALRRLFGVRNFLVLGAVVLPWFLGVSYLYPDFPSYGVVHESILRFTTDEFHRDQPFYFYPAVLLGGFFPWSLFLADPLLRALRAYRQLEAIERLCLIWIAVVLIFFSLSHSKRPGYLLIVAVPIALLASRCFEAAISKDSRAAIAKALARASFALGIFSLGLAAALVLAVSVPQLGQAASQLDAMVVEELIQRSVYLVGAFVLAAGLAIGAWRTRSARIAFAAFTILPLAVVLIGFGPWARVAERRSARSLATAVDLLAQGAEIVCVRCFPISLPFYLGQTITVVTETGSELSSNYVKFALERGDPWPRSLVRGSELETRVAERKRPLFLLADESGQHELEALAQKYSAPVVPVAPGYVGARIPTAAAAP